MGWGQGAWGNGSTEESGAPLLPSSRHIDERTWRCHQQFDTQQAGQYDGASHVHREMTK